MTNRDRTESTIAYEVRDRIGLSLLGLADECDVASGQGHWSIFS